MARAVRLPLVADPAAHDHVELVIEQKVDHRRAARGIVSAIAVYHDVHVCVDIGEHAAYHVSLPLLRLLADDGSCNGGHRRGSVDLVVVVDVYLGVRNGPFEIADYSTNRGGLVVAGNKHSDAHFAPLARRSRVAMTIARHGISRYRRWDGEACVRS